MSRKWAIKFEDETFVCAYVDSNKAAHKTLQLFEKSKAEVFGLDTETTWAEGYKGHDQAGLDPHLSRIRLLQLYDPESRVAAVFDLFHVDIRMFSVLLSKRLCAAHYAVFDISQLRHKGVRVQNCDCTLIMANMIHHATVGTDFRGMGSLDKCFDREFGVYIPKEFQRSDWSVAELSEEQLRYAALDVFLVHKLREKYAAKVNKLRMWKVYTLYRAVQQPIVSMALNGMKMDDRLHKKLIAEWESKREAAERQLKQVLKGVNPRSPAQMTEWLTNNLDESTAAEWPRSESGKFYATDYETLVEYKYLPFVEPLVEYKKYDKLCTTYGRKLLLRTNPVTKRVHGSFTISQTRTGRMSGNLQQFPRDNKDDDLYFRKLFIAEEGNVLVGADYSQIELRVAGEVSGDPIIKRAFEKGVDLHRLFAKVMTSVPKLEDVSNKDRQEAKISNFGLLFGTGAPGLQRQAKYGYGIELSLSQCEKNVSLFRNLYKVLRKWQLATSQLAEKTHMSVTPLGKKRRLLKGKTYTVSMNVPIQGGAGEVLQIALVYLEKEFVKKVASKGWDIRLINTVHDEIIVECKDKKEIIEYVQETMTDCMTRAYLKVFPKATTYKLVKPVVGKTWAEAKD